MKQNILELTRLYQCLIATETNSSDEELAELLLLNHMISAYLEKKMRERFPKPQTEIRL